MNLNRAYNSLLSKITIILTVPLFLTSCSEINSLLGERQLCGSSSFGSKNLCCVAEVKDPGGLVMRSAHKCVKDSIACAQLGKKIFPDEIDGIYTDTKTKTFESERFPDCVSSNTESNDSAYRLAAKNYINNIIENKYKVFLTSDKKNDPYQCQAHCKNNDVFCETTSLEGDISGGFNKIKEIFDSGKNVIPKNDIMSKFGQKKDECKRGDLILIGGEIKNTGQSDCIATLDNTEGELLKVAFPKEFRASYYSNKGIDLVINEEKYPVLISHSVENSLLNGSLSYLHIGPDQAIVRIDNMCIAANIGL